MVVPHHSDAVKKPIRFVASRNRFRHDLLDRTIGNIHTLRDTTDDNISIGEHPDRLAVVDHQNTADIPIGHHPSDGFDPGVRLTGHERMLIYQITKHKPYSP